MCYNRAQKIVVVTEGIRQHLIQGGIPPAKLELIPNGANTELFRPRPEEGAKLREELRLGDKFVVIYAGIHGVAQGMETLVEAAQLLQGERGIHFLFIGEGPKKAEVTSLKERYKLSNLTLLSERPREEMPAYLSAADVALVPLRKLDLFRDALPSKIFDAWACGCPIILSIDGEAHRVLEQAQAGIHVEPENTKEMAAAIRQVKAGRALLQQYGENGRRFVEAHYSRQRQAERLEGVLREIVEKRE